MKAATLLPVLALAWAASCSRCGREPALPDASPPDETEAPEVLPRQEEEHRLPKHDWNGLTVMMREAEAREALEAVGFTLIPSRLEAFPILDEDEHALMLVPILGYTPPLVIMETEKSDGRPLSSVYGLRLYFHRNRLYSFQPIYYADPVDLVEPGDEAVPPSVMRERLLETFGDPTWMARGAVTGPRQADARTESMTAWVDKDLIVLFRSTDGDGPPAYDLHFFSPEGNNLVADLVVKLTKKKASREKGREPAQ
ncbi:MAG: hypothetical protein JRG91_18725 [Deltaproteobacteria bacterium]|nr:hypothetical protein [Deltaproteobacteria bacterium]